MQLSSFFLIRKTFFLFASLTKHSSTGIGSPSIFSLDILSFSAVVMGTSHSLQHFPQFRQEYDCSLYEKIFFCRPCPFLPMVYVYRSVFDSLTLCHVLGLAATRMIIVSVRYSGRERFDGFKKTKNGVVTLKIIISTV